MNGVGLARLESNMSIIDGGKSDPSKMQWQTVQDAKAKDKWE